MQAPCENNPAKGHCGQIVSAIAQVSPTEQGQFSMTDAIEAYWAETDFLTDEQKVVWDTQASEPQNVNVSE